jgi:putative endonuclease
MNAGGNDTTTTTSGRGQAAEALAARYLARHGLAVVARNFRIRGGEIDLVCRDGKTLVFVEVRLRSRSDFGGAAASITAGKRRRIVLAARHYLASRPAAECRFDCVLLSGLDEFSIEWIRNAFAADD